MISIGIYSMIPPARQEIKSISRIGIWWMVAFCVLLYFGNLIFFSALVEAPNPGLARAILSLEIIGTAVLGVILSSKAALTTRQIAGIFTIILGTVGVVYE
jgi:drug/metabolite transporter (DMT)-like permease